VAHAETLFFVDDNQPQVLELDVLGENAVRADDNIDFALFNPLHRFFLLPGVAEAAHHLNGDGESGEAALDLIRNPGERINLLITDVVMPHMDGPGLVREVREINPEMKVIFISGYTEDAFRQRLDSDVGIEFLPKPFSLKELAAKVRDVLGARVA